MNIDHGHFASQSAAAARHHFRQIAVGLLLIMQDDHLLPGGGYRIGRKLRLVRKLTMGQWWILALGGRLILDRLQELLAEPGELLAAFFLEQVMHIGRE